MKNTYQVFIPCETGEPREISIALLGSLGFNAFDETNEGIHAYMEEGDWDEKVILDEIEALLQMDKNNFEVKKLEAINYNELWESKLQPVLIPPLAQIQPAGRKPEPGFRYSLQITPKMSFGTGHHPTTRLMIQALPESQFKNSTVLDLGSGTGILGILAAQMGAKSVLGIDIEEWCTENARENAQLNEVLSLCQFETGTLNMLPIENSFDILLANINRNILLELSSDLANKINPNGFLLISGFFEEDILVLTTEFENTGLTLTQSQTEDRWACLTFRKQL
jgi:ribosomal protein L11 methyltransferase